MTTWFLNFYNNNNSGAHCIPHCKSFISLFIFLWSGKNKLDLEFILSSSFIKRETNFWKQHFVPSCGLPKDTVYHCSTRCCRQYINNEMTGIPAVIYQSKNMKSVKIWSNDTSHKDSNRYVDIIYTGFYFWVVYMMPHCIGLLVWQPLVELCPLNF